MRYLAIGVLLAAVAGSVHGQATTWGTFESGESKGIGIQAADGSQLIFKCDKPGRSEVYALVLTDKNLVEPYSTYVMRPIKVRLDEQAPYEDNWRFYEHYIVAVNKGRERSLNRLLRDFGTGQKLELLLYPDPRSRTPVTLNFDIAGAQEALTHVFEACGDTPPA